LASNATANDFQSAAVFLRAGGQRGPQRKILREGTYAINLAQFVVLTDEGVFCLPLTPSEEQLMLRMAELIEERHGFTPIVLSGKDDLVGVVTVHEGPALADGQIIAPTVGSDPIQVDTYHNRPWSRSATWAWWCRIPVTRAPTCQARNTRTASSSPPIGAAWGRGRWCPASTRS